ncbi:MAG: hypothetical protein CUN49_07200 [Candidatus Thermofonsia Clade 1 bacterium]|uniref:Uncharacterized protein n=1 Tax=Candidatus Thermofonsia Clade 1 bacterium TaxID=2364210 RepID=A0A2M8PF23_9CHLR|nr:MAG: hypothetical protein CUN49_07200 [Candidatus Thermofonsia Clade 1 bacterium]
MKSSFYKLVMLALVGLLAFVPALAVSAQDCPSGISASDCALIASATGENAAKLTSFAMDFTVDAVIKGVEANDVTLSVKGNGGIDISKINPAATDPAEILAGLVLGVAMSGSLKGTTDDQSGEIELRIVNGLSYLRIPEIPDGNWVKIDLLSSILTQQLSLGLGAAQGGNMDDIGGLLGNLNNPALAGLFGAIQTVYTASDGPTIEVSTRAITATTDLKPFLQALADPNVSEALSQFLPQDDPDTAQIRSFLPLLGLLFTKATIVSTQYYGTDGTFRGFKLELALAVDGQMAAMLTGSPNNVDVRFTLDVRLSKLGEPYTVEVPAVIN